MEEAPENGKEPSHSAHTDGMNECNYILEHNGLGQVFFSVSGVTALT